MWSRQARVSIFEHFCVSRKLNYPNAYIKEKLFFWDFFFHSFECTKSYGNCIKKLLWRALYVLFCLMLIKSQLKYFQWWEIESAFMKLIWKKKIELTWKEQRTIELESWVVKLKTRTEVDAFIFKHLQKLFWRWRHQLPSPNVHKLSASWTKNQVFHFDWVACEIMLSIFNKLMRVDTKIYWIEKFCID